MKKIIFQYLKTIFLWILIVSFIVNIKSFITNINPYITPTKITKDPTNENLIKTAKNMETDLNKVVTEMQDIYGEDYPALGIVYYKTILHYSSQNLVQNFLFSLISGFALGNIIYFVFIAKLKKYKLFLVLALVLFISAFFLTLTDILTNYANNEIFKFSLNQIFWNMEVSAIPYTIASLIIIVFQKIYSSYIEIRYS